MAIETIEITLQRDPGTTRFRRPHSIADTLPAISLSGHPGPPPPTRVKVDLTAEAWRLLGCPNSIHVTIVDEADSPIDLTQ